MSTRPPLLRNPALTLVLILALAGLLVYALATRDPLGYAILALFAVFAGLPALVLLLGNRSLLRRRRDPAQTPDGSVDRQMRPDEAPPGSPPLSGEDGPFAP